MSAGHVHPGPAGARGADELGMGVPRRLGAAAWRCLDDGHWRPAGESVRLGSDQYRGGEGGEDLESLLNPTIRIGLFFAFFL